MQYSVSPQYLIGGEIPAGMVLKSPQIATTTPSSSSMTVSPTQARATTHIVTSKPNLNVLKPTQQTIPSNKILVKSQPTSQVNSTSQNGTTTQVRKADGTTRDAPAMQSAMLTHAPTIQSPRSVIYQTQPGNIRRYVPNQQAITIQPGQSNGQPVIYYNGTAGTGSSQFLPFQTTGGLQPMIRTVVNAQQYTDNNNYGTNKTNHLGQTYLQLAQPMTSATPTSNGTFLTNNTNSVITTSVPPNSPQIMQNQQHILAQDYLSPTRSPAILKRKNGILVHNSQLRSPPSAVGSSSPHTSDSLQAAVNVSGQPPVKQAKLENSVEPVHIKVAGSTIKYTDGTHVITTGSHPTAETNRTQPIIRSPNRGNRRKQNLESSPLTIQPQPSSKQSVDEASTDEAEECEDEQPKHSEEEGKDQMKIQLEPYSNSKNSWSSVLPKYRKGLKYQNAQSNAKKIKVPRAIRTPSRTPTDSGSGHPTIEQKSSSSSKSEGSRMHVNGHDFKSKRTVAHFITSGDVRISPRSESSSSWCSTSLCDDRLQYKELKQQSKCCIFKLKKLNKELQFCQAEQHNLQTKFSQKINKEFIIKNMTYSSICYIYNRKHIYNKDKDLYVDRFN